MKLPHLSPDSWLDGLMADLKDLTQIEGIRPPMQTFEKPSINDEAPENSAFSGASTTSHMAER